MVSSTSGWKKGEGSPGIVPEIKGRSSTRKACGQAIIVPHIQTLQIFPLLSLQTPGQRLRFEITYLRGIESRPFLNLLQLNPAVRTVYRPWKQRTRWWIIAGEGRSSHLRGLEKFLEGEGEVSYFFGNLLAGSLMEGLRSRDYAGGRLITWKRMKFIC